MPLISVVTPSIRPEGLKIVQECLAQQSFQDFEWLVELGIPGKGHDLNAAYNRLLRRAKGELIVSYQDYIQIDPEGLRRFWDAYVAAPKFYTAPVGKVENWGDEAKWDWRIYPEAHMDWLRWEIDWACAPLAALKEIGGFDEELDKFWSFDNVNVGLRASIAGYQFAHLPDNPAIALDHDKKEPHPFREKYNTEFHNERLDAFRMGLTLPPMP